MPINTFGPVLTLGASGGLGYHLWCAIQGIVAAKWPTARATIERSEFEVDVGTRTSDIRASVEYTYSVDGVQFSGDRYRFGPFVRGVFEGRRDLRSQADAARERYSRGQVVDVHYDPKAPRRSVLEPGTSAQVWLWVGVEIVGLALGLVITWVAKVTAA